MSRKTLTDFLKFWTSAYIIIYAFPFPLTYITIVGHVFDMYMKLPLEAINLWVGQQILGLSELEKIQSTGSGDTTFDYVALLTYALLAVLIAALCTQLFKKTTKTDTIFQYSLIYARYYVGIVLIQYGIVKFLEGQFPSLNLFDMEMTYGASSPMGLAWRFFGYSPLYKIFMGLSEVIAGFFLLFRRTHVLGALLAIAVTVNIVFVNFSFDVPVKLFSSHLLAFSIIVLLPHFKGLFQLFVLHKESRLTIYRLPRLSKKWRVGLVAVKIFVIGFIPLSILFEHVYSQSNYIFLNEWEGVYTVSNFQSLSENKLSEESHFSKVILSNRYMVIYKGQKANWYRVTEIFNDGELEFSDVNDQEKKYKLKIYATEDQNHSLQFSFGENVYLAETDRKLIADFLLANRGFHWINEYPYNR